MRAPREKKEFGGDKKKKKKKKGGGGGGPRTGWDGWLYNSIGLNSFWLDKLSVLNFF